MTKKITAETSISLEIQKLADSLPFYLMLVDEDHRILLANKAVEECFGVSPAQIIGRYCPQVIHGIDGPFPGCPLEEAAAKGQPVERELFHPETGQWVMSSAYPIAGWKHEGRRVFLHLARDVTERKQALERINRNLDTQRVMNTLLGLSLEPLSLEAILNQALELILSVSWLAVQSMGCVFLVEEQEDELVMKAQRGLTEEAKVCARLRFGRCLCGLAARNGEVVFADCVDDRHEIRYPGMGPHGHYCIPIRFGGKTRGVLNVYIREGHRRDPEEEAFLVAISNTLAGIIQHMRTERELETSFEKLRKAMRATVQAISRTTEVRDPYTAGHQQRVADLARAIATEMGLPKDRIEGIRVAGVIHDIGKISVPVEILAKPGRLTADEFNIIKTHSQVGYDILKDLEFPWPIAKIVHQHHERIDGSGYPLGLSGGDILQEAKILTVADVVEAICSHRPYRPGLGIDKALAEISEKRGEIYDSEAADACLKLFRENRFEFKELS